VVVAQVGMAVEVADYFPLFFTEKGNK